MLFVRVKFKTDNNNDKIDKNKKKTDIYRFILSSI